MGEPLEMPSPPRPKRLNRLALVAVLVLLGVAVAAVFSTLAPPRPAKVAGEVPDGGGPPRPGFLEREPLGAGAGGASTAGRGGEAASGQRDAAARADLDAAARGELEAATRAELESAVPGAERGATAPEPGSRQEAYRRALLAPVTPARTAAGGSEGAAGGREAPGAAEGAAAAEAAGERIARFGFLAAAGAAGGQLQDGGVAAAQLAPPAPPVAGGGPAPASGREHQGFLHAAAALAPADLRVRRDRAGAGIVVEAGSVIPAALLTAVDSDVAGPLVAQVTQDVFDREQRQVAIPRGSRLIGAYDNQVALGERRLLVAWGRVIFPDGSGVSFPGLPAASPSGEAGLPGSVDNHLARVFGSAVLLSILSAGVQLSQPQESATFGSAASARQVAAAAVGQELSSVAIEMLRRQLSVPPTLRIAAGTRFYVFLRGDLRFEEAAPE
ncbi:MAG TPA: TrbI/VirB10 family protein [Thermoanaerobaculia bacterium]|jgi:type IV secretion system protein VirB10|nr:TrbI/VirB10 family protein [Thermoanaerobaculia bacterium]